MSLFDKIKSGFQNFINSTEKSFESSPCDICGKQLSFYEKIHLADGFCCSSCHAEASRYFVLKHKKQKPTVALFKEHLQDRHENRKLLDSFTPTRIIGDHTKVIIDEDKFQFLIYCSKDHRSKSYAEANVDVFSCSSIVNCTTDIEEIRTEISKQNSNGAGGIPFYRYTYDFYIKIDMNHSYAETIRVKLNPDIIDSIGTVYRKYEQIGRDICEALSTNRNTSREAAHSQKQITICPWCGTKLSHNIGKCEQCGGTL